MKKIYSFMVAAVALFAAASCNKELPQEENLPTVGETVVYTASTDAADTKAVLNETTKKSEWVAGDAITVHDGTKGWTFTAAEAGANVDFSNSEGFGEYRPVLAVYPAAGEGVTYTANVAAKTAKAYIPTWQQAQAGTYDSPAALAVAYSEGNTFAFKNAHALLKFTVNTDNVTHVIFHGNGSEAITGDVYVTLGEDGVESVECLKTEFTEQQWNEETQKNEDVKVEKYGTWVECYAYHGEANKYFAKDQTYYIAVAPQKFEGGVTVKVRINEGEELVAKTTTNKVETKINTILNLGEIKYEAPVVHEWAVAGTFNEWSTTANPMELVNGYYVAKNVTGLNYSDPNVGETGSSTGIKFVNNGTDWRGGEGQVTAGTWAYVWGDGGNIYVDGATAETAYDIYLNPSEGDYGKFVIVAAGAAMPEDKPATAHEWAVAGTFNGWNTSATPMVKEGDYYVARNVTGLNFTAQTDPNDQSSSTGFKFVQNGDVWKGTGEYGGVMTVGSWSWVWGDNGSNICVNGASAETAYDIYLNPSQGEHGKFVIVAAGDPMPEDKPAEEPEVTPGETSEWAIIGDFNGSGQWVEKQMLTTVTSKVFVIEDVVIPTDYFSILVKKYNDSNWTVKYGGGIMYFNPGNSMKVYTNGSDICITKAGTYDFYFDLANTMLYVVNPGVDYTTVSEQTVNGEEPKQEEPEVTANVLYFKPNNKWYGNSKRCSAYFFNNTKGIKTWVSMKEISTQVYEVNIPEGYTFGDNVIFCSMNPNTAVNDWSHKWNQTADLVIPTDGNNFFVANDGWSGIEGTWSKR